jgi:hypothetical protein
MARTKTTPDAPELSEFDEWDEQAESQALEELAARSKVKHIIKGDLFWALAPRGRIYKLPLALSITDFEALVNAQSDSESIEQIKTILHAFAGEAQAKQLESEPIQVMQAIINDYGATIARSQGAALGKSDGSPASSENMSA